MSAAAKLLTPGQLALRWRGTISLGTLANWRSLGKGPPFLKLGGRVRYPVDGLVAYEKQNTHGSIEHELN
jgi:hypothetical protein